MDNPPEWFGVAPFLGNLQDLNNDVPLVKGVLTPVWKPFTVGYPAM